MHRLHYLIATVLIMLGLEAQAITITTTTIGGTACDYTAPDTTCWHHDATADPTLDPLGVVNPDAADVALITGEVHLELLYKAEVGTQANPATVEEGGYASSYETSFTSSPLDPENAFISYLSGNFINCPSCYLLVKDGNNDPRWYLFDLGAWNGQDGLNIEGFWPNKGGISHVSIFGVPEPTPLVLLGLGLLAIAFIRKKAI